jgi:hypothetical protein
VHTLAFYIILQAVTVNQPPPVLFTATPPVAPVLAPAATPKPKALTKQPTQVVDLTPMMTGKARHDVEDQTPSVNRQAAILRLDEAINTLLGKEKIVLALQRDLMVRYQIDTKSEKTQEAFYKMLGKFGEMIQASDRLKTIMEADKKWLKESDTNNNSDLAEATANLNKVRKNSIQLRAMAN